MTQPQIEVPPPKEGMSTKNKIAVWAAVVALLGPTAAALIAWHPWVPPPPPPAPAPSATASPVTVSAKDVLQITSLKSGVLNMIAADQLNVEISGEVKKPIPDGEVVWAAFRLQQDPGDNDGSLQRGGLFFIPDCTVTQGAGTFDCGSPQFGPDEAQPATYFVYVGLADANTEKQLVQIQREQNATPPNWNHAAPSGVDVAQVDTVVRPKKAPTG
jgi:hypothetical protein